MKINAPVFIVGMPRSGTKLLRTLLNQHPDLAILSVETEFLPQWHRRWDGFGPLSDWANFSRFYEWTTKLSYFYLYAQEVGPIIEARTWFDACEGKADIASVFAALACHDLDLYNNPKAAWGDKSPSYIRHIGLLNSIYPDARFVHIVRDVRDYALSLNKSFGKDMLRASQRWADDVSLARQDGSRIGSRYMELHYEDLLAGTKNEMQRICEFLQLSFYPSLTQLETPAERDFEQQRGAGTGRTDIVANNTGKWRDAMDGQLRQKIEAIAGPALREAGYEAAGPSNSQRLTPTSMTLRQIKDGINLLRTNTRFGLLEAVRFYGRAYFTGAPNHLDRD